MIQNSDAIWTYQAPVIARRSFVWRQRDSIEEAFDVLNKRRICKHVRGLCGLEGNKVVQRREAEAYCNPRRPWFPVAARWLCFSVAWRRFWLGFGVGERG
jgi:hypothetical protein